MAAYTESNLSLAASVESLARRVRPDRGVYVSTSLLPLANDCGQNIYRVLAYVSSPYWHLSLIERAGTSTDGDDAARDDALYAIKDELIARIQSASE